MRLSDNVMMQDLHYWYDPVGNITEIEDYAQQTLFYANTIIEPTQKFNYDALYRLTTAEGREQIGTATFGAQDNWNDASWCVPLGSDAAQRYTQYYTYDDVGNILQLQHVAGSGSYTRDYNYSSSSNRLESCVVGSSEYAYEYNDRGNMVAMPHLAAMDWNVDNELQAVSRGGRNNWYQYSGGQRTRKYLDKGSYKEESIYFGSFEIYRKFDNTSSLIVERQTVHVSDDTGRIAMLEKRTIGSAVDDNDTLELLTRYIYSNHLQSSSLELDELGDIISYEEYHPYGTTAFQANSTAIVACAKRYRYTGKERDEESGLYYHGARYYIPWLCRWTASDPLESKYAGMSSYNYSFNNPIMFNDPSGMEGEHKGSWVRTGSGSVKYNSRVENVDDATRSYGDGASIYNVGDSYHSREGNDIVLGVNGKFTNNGAESLSPDDKANYREGFWEGVGSSVWIGLGNLGDHFYNNPNNAGYGMSGTKLDGSAFTIEDVKRYETNWSQVLDPQYQIESFSNNLVYGSYNFVGGIAEKDGRRTANAVPPLLSSIGTISMFRGMGKVPSGLSIGDDLARVNYAAGPSKNATLGRQLNSELAFQEKASLFNANGSPKPEVINLSTPIMRFDELNNISLKNALMLEGGKASDWNKMSYTTGGSSGIDLHFYYNKIINKTYLDYDYKVKFGNSYFKITPSPKQ